MIIQSKFESKCPDCGEIIQVGQSIKWTKGQPAKHEVCITLEEKERIKTMDDSQLIQAVCAMATTLGQRITEAKRKGAIKYKSELVKEWKNRYGDKPMFA